MICGCLLLALTFWIQVFLTEAGRGPGHLTATFLCHLVALFLFGFPCGVLLNFARTGRRVWLAGLVVLLIAGHIGHEIGKLFYKGSIGNFPK